MSISEFIFSWIRDIVLLFIIITLVDLVMPKGSMSRYINFVIGLLIIFTVINPFMNLTNLDFQLDREVFKNIDHRSGYDEDIVKGQNDEIEYLYKEKLTREIKDFVESNSEHKISSIHIEIHKEEDNFGAISYLNLWIDDGNVEINEEHIEIQVQPVALEYNTKIEKNDDFLDIKELISNKYEIDKDLIVVSTNKLED